jgi:hypothetical protein
MLRTNSNPGLHGVTLSGNKKQLVLVGEVSPDESSRGSIVISRRDLETKHEEANNITVHQVCAQISEQTGITVINIR